MGPTEKNRILNGRNAIDQYRLAHIKIHSTPRRRSVPQEHTPHFDALKGTLSALGYESLHAFFSANDALVEGELNKMYIREGECNDCGECCKRCEHYINSVCDIYDTRPDFCKSFPTVRQLLPENLKCSYYLSRTEYQPTIEVNWK